VKYWVTLGKRQFQLKYLLFQVIYNALALLPEKEQTT